MKETPRTPEPSTSPTDVERLLRAQRDLFQAVAPAHDLDRTLKLCLEAALEVSGLECGGLYLTDGDGGLRLAPTIGLSEGFVAAVNRFPAGGTNAQLVMRGLPLYLGREEIEAIQSRHERREGLRALAVIPILQEERVVGCLNIASRSIDLVPPAARPALESIGAAASMLVARAQADEALRGLNRRLQGLSLRLLEVQEEERRRLARELHDEVGQQLAGLVARLEATRRSPAPDLKVAIDAALAIAAETIEMVGDLSLELRPSILDDYGLAAALRWHAERVQRHSGMAVDLGIAGLAERLPTEVETAAYRIVQQALTNVVRHAGTDAAQVRLWIDGGLLRIQVADEGRGFDLRRAEDGARGFGLATMRERAELLGGAFDLESEPGMGTRLLATLPVPGAGNREPGR